MTSLSVRLKICDDVIKSSVALSLTLISLLFCSGLGFADVENRLPCKPDTVMRIASISKPITMAAVGKLVELGKLDLDKDVTEYTKSWPDKHHNGEKVVVCDALCL